VVTENVNIVVSLRGATTASRGIRGIGVSSRAATVAVRALGVALVAVAGGATVGALFRLSDAATEVGNRIRTTTSSTEVFLSVQQRLFEVASRTGASIEDTSRLFQRLTVGTRDLGVGSARVVNVVEGLNAALVVSGATAREASAALLQLGQGLASDNLSGEELRSLRENLPQLAQALADELGTGIGNLKELGRQGRLNAETVFPALERAIESFTEKLRNGEVVFTFAQAFNAVRNEILRFFTIIQSATGATQDLNRTIFEFADGLAERLVEGLANALDFVAGVVDRFQALRQQGLNVLAVLDPIVSAFSFLGKIGVIAVQGISLAFNQLLQRIAGANALLQRFLRFIGQASDTDVALADATLEAQTETLKQGFDDLFETIDNFGEASFLELATGITNVEDAATSAGNTIRDVADSLRNAAQGVPTADDPDAAPPTFLERAARNTEDIRQEAGSEDIDVPSDLSESIAQSWSEGLRAGIQGGDFLGTLRNSLETASQEALLKGFERSIQTAQGLLEEAFRSVGEAIQPIFGDAFGSLGPVISDVISGALQFAILQGLNALLGGGGNSARSSTGNVQSAVTSTQAVRGVVAGPTEIAIANVGRNIAEAVEPLLEEARTQTGVQRGILDAVRAGGTGVGASGADTDVLAFGSAPAASV